MAARLLGGFRAKPRNEEEALDNAEALMSDPVSSLGLDGSPYGAFGFSPDKQSPDMPVPFALDRVDVGSKLDDAADPPPTPAPEWGLPSISSRENEPAVAPRPQPRRARDATGPLEALRAAQAKDETRDRFQDVSDALYAGFSRSPLKQARESNAARNEKELLSLSEQQRRNSLEGERIGWEREDRDLARQQREFQKSLGDRRSSASKQARDRIRGTSFGRKLLEQIGEAAFENLSANDLPGMSQLAMEDFKRSPTELQLEEQRRKDDEATQKSERDKAAIEAYITQFGDELGAGVADQLRSSTPEAAMAVIKEIEAEKRANIMASGQAFAREEKKNDKRDALAASSVNYLGRRLEPETGVPLDSAALNEVRRKAAASATVVNSLKEMGDLLDQLVKDPTNRQLRNRVESQAALVAPKINVAQGQGAMGEGEFTRVKQSVGDIASPDFWISAVQSDPAALRARTRQAQKYFIDDMKQTAKAYRLKFAQ